MSEHAQDGNIEHVELDPDHEDVIVRYCNRSIRYGVRAMSVFMVLVIFLAIVDAWYLLYERLLAAPVLIIEVSDILAIFSAALIVLIAIEIYTNITLYLTADVIHVKLVVATALMAIARKVITLDDKSLEPAYFLGYAALGLAFGVTTGSSRAKAGPEERGQGRGPARSSCLHPGSAWSARPLGAAYLGPTNCNFGQSVTRQFATIRVVSGR